MFFNVDLTLHDIGKSYQLKNNLEMLKTMLKQPWKQPGGFRKELIYIIFFAFQNMEKNLNFKLFRCSDNGVARK